MAKKNTSVFIFFYNMEESNEKRTFCEQINEWKVLQRSLMHTSESPNSSTEI